MESFFKTFSVILVKHFFNSIGATMNEDQPEVYICVLNWNGWQDTVECLQSIFANSYTNYRVVVIDNDSQDHSVREIKQWFIDTYGTRNTTERQKCNNLTFITEYDKATAEKGGNDKIEKELSLYPSEKVLVLIQSGANWGFAGGNNIGIKYALQKKADYVWLLNNDAVMDRNALKEMIEITTRNQQLGMIGSKLLDYDNPAILEAAGGGKNIHTFLLGIEGGKRSTDKKSEQYSDELGYIFGASLLVKTEAIKAVGLMDENYFFFSEEIDWNIRMKKAGWELAYCPNSVVYHRGSKSIQKTSPMRDYYFVRNLLFLLKKFYPYWLPIAFLRTILRLIKRMLTRNWSNAFAIITAVTHFIINRKGKYDEL